MSAKTIKERAKELIDNLSADQAGVILKLLERFDEERGMGGEAVKMRTKKLLAAFLLGVGLCSVPALGQGEIRQDIVESKVSLMDFYLLEARVDHMMWNLAEFLGEDRLYIDFYYDRDGRVGRNREFPESVDTMGKICITIRRRGDLSSYKSDFLLDMFSLKLTVIYASIRLKGYFLTLDMDTDIVGLFYKGKEWTPLGYFYQGEYYLWEK